MAWIIFVLFLLFAILMYTKRLPALLALPAMALLIALLSSSNHLLDALDLVFDKGATRLAGAMVNAVFGAILAQVVSTCRIAETLVKKVSELAGDRPIPVALMMMVATALAFLAISGLGAVIMIGTLVLPVMIGVGLRPRIASGIFLFGLSIGLVWNVAGWVFYHDVLKVSVGTVGSFATIAGITLTLAGLAYILVNARARRTAWTALAEAPAPLPPISSFALLTPLLPVLLVLGCKYVDRLTGGNVPSIDFNISAALCLTAVYGILTTYPKEIVNRLTGAMIEGIKSVAPVLGLMIGIGMVVTALTADSVKKVMAPALMAIIPHSPWGYILFFGLLSPLALYRGPLNLFGLGAGVGAVLTTIFAPHLVTGALMATGLVQSVCDPTNTHNVWIAEFTKTDVNEILKSTLPYVMVASFITLVYIALTHWKP